ncbi:DUF3011 domain-containing protein [Stenotrophomonas rhizophila]|jgi:hypothetical protein|uniref:DUF3011 domain-containing protein n=1 Tax=Stenotrophomonas rhizophila TaxID=216778 RepID=UPI0028B17179|nr:DUF3011 domain-containing protein [Stenotrophomonas rhizophila]
MRKNVVTVMLMAACLGTTGCASLGGFPDFSGPLYPPPTYPVYPPPPTDGGRPDSEVVSCHSIDHRFSRCDVQIARKDSVHLISRDSRSPCEFGRDWGQDNTSLWVDNGCRATFRIERYYWR